MVVASIVVLIYVAFNPCCVSAQTSPLYLYGKTVDIRGDIVPYVSVRYKHDQSQGLYSNADGRFEFAVGNKTDTLLFSCIGFEEAILPVSGSRNSDTILVTLNQSVYTLPEIEFRFDSAIAIVERAIEKLPQTLDSSPSILQGFFREIVRSDKTYDRLVEAAVDVYDPGYLAGKFRRSKLSFQVRQLRKSEDYMELDWKSSIFKYLYPRNGLYSEEEWELGLFNHDYIRRNEEKRMPFMNAYLNSGLFNAVKLILDSTIVHDGEMLWRILIIPKTTSDGLLPTGVLFISQKDFAIHRMEITMYLHKDNAMKNLAVPGESYTFKTVIQYTRYLGKMYLTFLHRIGARWQGNYTKFKASKGLEGNFYDEKTFMANEIITKQQKPKKFSRKERQSIDVDLYDEDFVYDREFWQKYPVLSETPLSPNKVKDLERKMTLEEQYIKNGKNE